MILSTLEKTLIELGMPTNLATNLEMAHNRHIRGVVENNPSLKRISEFMENFKDETIDEMGEEGLKVVELSIANGAIMHFSKAKLNIEFEGKIKERIGSNKTIQGIVSEYQALTIHPEYDLLSVEDEFFEL